MQNFRSEFTQIRDFLKAFEGIYNLEVLNDYPTSFQCYKKEWLSELRNLNDHALWQVDANYNSEHLPAGELKDLFSKIHSLIDRFQVTDEELDLPRSLSQSMKEKKRHEVSKLVPLLCDHIRSHSVKQVIDIGGGVGHLSRILSTYSEIPTLIIEQNEALIKKGLKIKDRFYEDVLYSFYHASFSKDLEIRSDINLNDTLLLGLHTCGGLANHLIEFAIKNNIKSLVNFGCCYLRMIPEKEVNISEHGKAHGLSLGKYALTLATRSHTVMTLKDFELKKRVKFYRYCLHLFLKTHYGMDEFVGVGDAKPRDYYAPFSEYVKARMDYLDLELKESPAEVDYFYNDPGNQQATEDLFLANIIRWKFGRLLELYLLYDRCLRLEEAGYQVSMKQIFHENLSPRNLGIFANKQ